MLLFYACLVFESAPIFGEQHLKVKKKKKDEVTVFKCAISKTFTAAWHKMPIIYLWRLKGLWINTNDSAITWPAAEPSGFQNSLSILQSI